LKQTSEFTVTVDRMTIFTGSFHHFKRCLKRISPLSYGETLLCFFCLPYVQELM